MASIHLDKVEKTYDNGFHAIHELTLDVRDGEFLVLVGPSGCGKSTALRMVAGLEAVTGGEIRIGDRRVNEVEPKNRDLAMVFQDYALYPHMTVAENIGFPLKIAKIQRAERKRRVEEAARILELSEQLGKKPGQLSGGQRQRVAMGRAIVREPAAFLMDEPLSNLDAKLRVQMRADISRLQRDLGVTTIYVTHDQVEAMTMGDRVAVLKHGHLQQVDTPQNLYDRPANVFVASFVGSPSMNLYEATLDGDDVVLGPHRLRVPPSAFERRPALRDYQGRPLVLGVRPEDLTDAALERDLSVGSTFPARCELTESLGNEVIVHFGLDARRVDPGNPDIDLSADVVTVHAVARFQPRTEAAPGKHTEVAVKAENLHYFDPASGASIWS